MTRVQKREMGAIFDLVEALDAGGWPVAADYVILSGVIHPYRDKENRDWKVTASRPLAAPEIFLSFARLAARGKPSEGAILAWVREHGLLRRRDAARHNLDRPHGLANQAPMKLGDFRAEAKNAYRLLRIFELYRGGDVEALRGRVRLQRISPERDPDEDEEPPEGPFAEELLDGAPTGHITVADEVLTEDEVLGTVLAAVHKDVDRYIASVRPAFGIGGRLAFRVPDLLTAMYWQFAGLVDGKQPVAICEGCGNTFVKTRSNKVVCKPGCRTTKKRNRLGGGRQTDGTS